MNISRIGNPKTLTAQAGAEETRLSAEGALRREVLLQGGANLTVTETPAQAGVAGIPPAELEKAMMRDDGLGKCVDRVLAGVRTDKVEAFVAHLISTAE